MQGLADAKQALYHGVHSPALFLKAEFQHKVSLSHPGRTQEFTDPPELLRLQACTIGPGTEPCV